MQTCQNDLKLFHFGTQPDELQTARVECFNSSSTVSMAIIIHHEYLRPRWSTHQRTKRAVKFSRTFSQNPPSTSHFNRTRWHFTRRWTWKGVWLLKTLRLLFDMQSRRIPRRSDSVIYFVCLNRIGEFKRTILWLPWCSLFKRNSRFSPGRIFISPCSSRLEYFKGLTTFRICCTSLSSAFLLLLQWQRTCDMCASKETLTMTLNLIPEKRARTPKRNIIKNT